MITIHKGDCRDVLRTLPDESVHCLVTSPPYFGLRDYGTAQWEGGDPACGHVDRQARMDQDRETPGGRGGSFRGGNIQYKNACPCGARRIDNQIGLEPTPDAYVVEMVAVFREVRRVLRHDGTLWLNLGDSYNANQGKGFDTNQDGGERKRLAASPKVSSGGLAPKQLLGIPWRVAFALQADGWYLRQDIIWAKPNPMPESVTDRCTKAHEYLFLLSKSARYYYDGPAIQEPFAYSGDVRMKTAYADATAKSVGTDYRAPVRQEGRNKRSVWEIATQPFPEAHFATFPPALVEPCIKAGTSERGCCAKCGAPWVREVEKGDLVPTRKKHDKKAYGIVVDNPDPMDQGRNRARDGHRAGMAFEKTTIGWSPSCSCWQETTPGALPSCTVLDPFAGAGTTGLVADRLGRNAILIELNPEYAAMIERRISDDAGLFADIHREAAE